MFSILLKKHIDVWCYTGNVSAYEYFPIANARDFIPSWWKDMPSGKADLASARMPSMKRCPGLIEHYKRGFVLPLWSDVEVVVDKTLPGGWSAAMADMGEVHSHDPIQHGGFLDSAQWFHMKLNSPWFVETSCPLDFVYCQPHWNWGGLNAELFTPTAYDTFFEGNHSTNVQLFSHRSSCRNFVLPAGMPVVHYIPVTDKKVVLHTVFDKDRAALYVEKNDTFSFSALYYAKKKLCRKHVL